MSLKQLRNRKEVWKKRLHRKRLTKDKKTVTLEMYVRSLFAVSQKKIGSGKKYPKKLKCEMTLLVLVRGRESKEELRGKDEEGNRRRKQQQQKVQT